MNKIVLLVAMSLIIISCNKETTSPEKDDACTLTKRIIHDTAGNVFTTVYYQYDQNNRLKEIYYNTKENLYQIIAYSNNLIASVTSYSSGIQVEKLSYDWGDKIIYCLHEINSTGEWEVFEKFDYELDDNNCIVKKQGYSERIDSWEKTHHYTYQWEDGNLMKAEEYVHDDLISTTTYFYDDYPNAYASLPKFLDLFAPYNWTKNNIYKYTIESSSLNYYHSEAYEIKYNEKNYPTEVKLILRNNNGELVETYPVIYEYSCE